MNKYIFITMNIGGINGAEQYIYNKYNYLKKQGYEVFIFSGRRQPILINGFIQFKELIHPALRFYPCSMNQNELYIFLKWFLSTINAGQDDTFIIESSNIISALWGELIAKKLRGLHFAYILSENHAYSEKMKDFLKFKLNRHELAGIREDSVGLMVGDNGLTIRDDMHIQAFCNNVIQKSKDLFSSLLDNNASATIGSIGRLEKKYALPLIYKLCDFFNENKCKRYNLVLIGGCADKRKLYKIRNAITACNNVNLLMTGPCYPIPRSLVDNIDLFISASGSAHATYYANRPTLKIDENTGDPKGILGYDLIAGQKEGALLKSLDKYIDAVLDQHIKIEYIDNIEDDYNQKMVNEFDRHLKIAKDQLRCKQEYYDVLNVKYTDFKYRFVSFISRVIGVKNAYFLVEKARIIVRE